MQSFIFAIYNFIVFPLLYFIIWLVSFFNKNVAGALKDRKKSLLLVQNTNFKSDQIIIIHAASMGEFEHIKPLIVKLNQTFKVSIIVTFFSPSGYNYIKSFPGVELFIYLPVDKPAEMRRFYQILNPNIIVLSKHDAWPNQIRIADKMDIPIFLINASLHKFSKRLKWPGKTILKSVYPLITTIYTISDEDSDLFHLHFPTCSIKKVGDTKFDQVIVRRDQALKGKLLPSSWYSDSMVAVYGSIWSEDFDIVKDTIIQSLTKEKELKHILVPHEPSEELINSIVQAIGKNNCCLYSDLDSLSSQQILIVNKIGVLAELYRYANIAYVGGGFKQGIHNVMEAAVYGVPVIYGPEIDNASEARRLFENGGSYIINIERDFNKCYNELCKHSDLRTKIGEKALKFAEQNTGATDVLINEWKKFLSY